MTHIDEHLSVTTYLKDTAKTVDGLAWIIVSAASIFCLLDILFGTNFIPLRDIDKPSKAITLLLSTPILVFTILIRSRQFPSSDNNFSSLFRAVLCIVAFFIINF